MKHRFIVAWPLTVCSLLCLGKGSSKGKSAEAEQAPPSKDELQKTIVQLLKKVDLDNVSYSV